MPFGTPSSMTSVSILTPAVQRQSGDWSSCRLTHRAGGLEGKLDRFWWPYRYRVGPSISAGEYRRGGRVLPPLPLASSAQKSSRAAKGMRPVGDCSVCLGRDRLLEHSERCVIRPPTLFIVTVPTARYPGWVWGSRRMCTARTLGTGRGRAGHSHLAFACLLPPARSQGANDNSRKLQASDVSAGEGNRRRLRVWAIGTSSIGLAAVALILLVAG